MDREGGEQRSRATFSDTSNTEHAQSFGATLRELRDAAGLTQEELASRAGLTAKAVSALERGERKRPYPHTVRSLAEALGLSDDERASLLASVPSRTTGSSAEDSMETPAEASTAPASSSAVNEHQPTMMPAPHTSLVGREKELSEIEDFLRRGARLLTLTGTGGVGKTRLALQAATLAQSLFDDGVAFVGLAPLGDAALVIPTIAQSLGLREIEGRSAREALYAHLKEKHLLLVLDNLEHLLEVVPEVISLIEASPNLSVLATSRAPLRVRGEQEYPVGPLGVPDPSRTPMASEVSGAPAVELFVERARAASPSFELTESNSAAVAAICWRLDGLPLALELAAARTRFLGPTALLSRLDRALEAGGGAARDLPERQRTMRSTLNWSHDLLHVPEKELFRRLSVFAGGWTLEAAEAVAEAVGEAQGGEAEDILSLLGNLVEQSLVVAEAEADGTVRYGMLEPVRQYAVEKLLECGEEEEVRRHHAAFYLALLEEAGPEIRGHDQAIWLDRLETELGNLRAALSWSVRRGEGRKIADASWTSWTYWWLSGHISEGRRWMEEALASEPGMPATHRARLLTLGATLGQAIGDFEASRVRNDESMELFRELGDTDGMYFAMGTAGLIALAQGQPDEAISLMEESAERRLELFGDRWASSAMFGFSATVALGQGDRDRARRLAERAISLAREIGAREAVSVALPTLAGIARADGDLERAVRLFEEGLVLSAEVGDGTNVAFYLEALAEISASEDRLERAARLWGAAGALLETVEVIAYPHAVDRTFYDRQMAAARERLDGQTWEAAWEEGRAMSTEEAVGYALEKETAL
jgi:predicted ATPase/transcriptional regulator with XRE-family HTH domain